MRTRLLASTWVPPGISSTFRVRKQHSASEMRHSCDMVREAEGDEDDEFTLRGSEIRVCPTQDDVCDQSAPVEARIVTNES